MDHSKLSLLSKSHYIPDFSANVKWELHHEFLKRISKKLNETVFEYKNIEAIRLCYHIGSRNLPAAYCLYFKYNKKWRNKQIFSSNSIKTDDIVYAQYFHFTSLLIKYVRENNSSLIITTGHSFSSWLFYLFSSCLLLGIAPLVYTYNVITLKECIWAFVIIFALCIPIISSMIKYFPKVVYPNQDIPVTVLPNLKPNA